MIRITNKSGLGKHTRIENENGSMIAGISGIQIDIRADSLVLATLDFVQSEIDIEAEPLLSLDTVRRCAEHYGYELIEDKNEQT